jgi:hypothetical protein
MTESKKRTPGSEYRRWLKEMDAADKRIRRWHQHGNKIQARYQDRRGMVGSSAYAVDEDLDRNGVKAYRVNLFNTNITTLKAMLYGNSPKVEVSRRYADPDDDVARVASTILGRLLNNDFYTSSNYADATFKHVLEDRLLPGFGLTRVRYEFDSETESIEAIKGQNGEVQAEGYEQTNVTYECAHVDYIHWDDVRWGWARTWDEVPWIAFRSYLTKSEAIKRFGEKVAEELTYSKHTTNDVNDKRLTSDETADAHQRVEIWEIWEKKSRCLYWWHRNFERTLDKKEDTLKLYDFWPCPCPWIANQVTNLFLPQPDFIIAQDLYNEIDQLETRIGIITEAVKVVGVYDKTNEGVKRIFTEGLDNDLIPVDSWAAFAEKGGLEGVISWMPLDQIVAALERLVEMRSDAMGLLYEVTGMSEIMRGNNGPDRETADASNNKRQFASVRVQSLQEELAQFVTETMCLKAEVICRHFEPKTIIEQSNILRTADGQNQQLIEAALNLIKEPSQTAWRIKIEPETMAMIDYQSMTAERTRFLENLGRFISASTQMVQLDNRTLPFMMEFVKWGMAGFKGNNEIEGVLDRAIDVLKQPKPPEEGDNAEAIKLQAQREKNQHELQIEQMKAQNRLNEENAKFQNNVNQVLTELKAQLAVIREEAAKDVEVEQAQSGAAMAEDDHQTENAMRQEEHQAKIDMKVDDHETKNAIKVKKTKEPDSGKKSVSVQ